MPSDRRLRNVAAVQVPDLTFASIQIAWSLLIVPNLQTHSVLDTEFNPAKDVRTIQFHLYIPHLGVKRLA